jgi:hypothetical protein
MVSKRIIMFSVLSLLSCAGVSRADEAIKNPTEQELEKKYQKFTDKMMSNEITKLNAFIKAEQDTITQALSEKNDEEGDITLVLNKYDSEFREEAQKTLKGDANQSGFERVKSNLASDIDPLITWLIEKGNSIKTYQTIHDYLTNKIKPAKTNNSGTDKPNGMKNINNTAKK